MHCSKVTNLTSPIIIILLRIDQCCEHCIICLWLQRALPTQREQIISGEQIVTQKLSEKTCFTKGDKVIFVLTCKSGKMNLFFCNLCFSHLVLKQNNNKRKLIISFFVILFLKRKRIFCLF